MGTVQLVSVTLNGFRRFEDACLTVDTKIVALLGPNEAGKTSLLDALTFLNGGKEFEDTDLTRDVSSPAESPVVSALFSLDDDDRKAVPGLNNSPSTRWWTVSRTREKLVTRLEPPIDDPFPAYVRAAATALDALRQVAESSGTPDMTAEIDHLRDDLDPVLAQPRPGSPDAGGELRARTAALLAGRTLPRKLNRPLREAVEAVERVLTAHAQPSPNDEAREALWSRTPDFLKFDEACRALRSDYDLTKQAVDPPAALKNLAAMAGLDLKALAAEIASRKVSAVQERLDAANAQLAEAVSERWSQAAIDVFVRTDGQRLYLLVRDNGTKYTAIAERSDGLRAFIALVGFLESARPSASSNDQRTERPA